MTPRTYLGFICAIGAFSVAFAIREGRPRVGLIQPLPMDFTGDMSGQVPEFCPNRAYRFDPGKPASYANMRCAGRAEE